MPPTMGGIFNIGQIQLASETKLFEIRYFLS